MQNNFEQCFKWLLAHEGGFVNNPRDPGGMTNLGATRANWAAWLGHDPTEAEMRALTPADVAPFYRAKYWQAMRCDDLPSGVDWVVMDFGVNSGIGRSAKFLQRVVGAGQDGQIGPLTLANVKACDPKKLIDEICDARQAFLESLPTFAYFGKGWTARVKEVRAQAKSLV